MTPASLTRSAYMTHILFGSNGTLGNYQSAVAHGVKPVINLIPGVKFSGSGTPDDPYIIS